jgi:hypothetical protein
MFSEQESTEELFAEVQPRRNTGRHVKEGHHLDLASPEVNAARFDEEINTDKGGLYSKEVAAERDKFEHILKIVRGRNNYRNSVRLHRCNSCWKPLESTETRRLCHSCSDLAKASRFRREKTPARVRRVSDMWQAASCNREGVLCRLHKEEIGYSETAAHEEHWPIANGQDLHLAGSSKVDWSLHDHNLQLVQARLNFSRS